MAFTFFHRPRPKQFHYSPRYYDPEDEKVDENGNELTEEEKRERRIKRTWNNARGTQSNRRNPRTVIWLVVIATFILYLLGTKAFTKMTTYLGTPVTETESAPSSENILGVVKDSTGKMDTLYRGELGGPFFYRVDSIANVKFSEMPLERSQWPAFYEKMKAELGDEYEIVRERLSEIIKEWEADDESYR